MQGDPELVDQYDGETYVLTAPRCFVTWRVPRGNEMVVARKRFTRGDKLTQIPEVKLHKLIDLGHAVAESDYDPEAIAAEKARKRFIYDQGATKTALIEWEMAKQRRAAAGAKSVGLPDADANTSTDEQTQLTDTGRTVDGIKLEDVDPDGSATDDDDEITGTGDDDVEDGGEAPEDYQSMDYPRLQQYAKQVTGSGAGGKEEIIARLDEHFAQ